MPKDNIRMGNREWSKYLWSRVKALFSGLDTRVTALEQGGGGGSVTVTDGDPTLAWGTRSTVGTINSTSLHVTMPAKPTYTAQDVGALPSNTTYVSGVKGDAENSYRSGNVNLTPANIGASPTGHTHSYLPLSGGTMTGKITFNKVQNAIAYTGTKATYDMIQFIDNTNDAYGNGISIGGGGATIIGGGESAGTAAAQVTGGSEILYLCNDGDVNIFSNVQNGWDGRKTFTFNASGNLVVPSGCRIGESGGALYLGNSGNQNWVYVQDMASQSGTDKWKIQQNGNATFVGTVTAGAFSGPLTGNVTGDCSGSAGSVAWGNVTGKPSEYTPANGSSYYAKHKGDLGSVIGNGTPAAATKTYFDNNIANADVNVAYNTSGAEYSLVFSRGSANFGSVIRWGYPDLYMRILRKQSGNWKSEDWEKMSAGYADSAGNVTGTVAVGHGGTGATSAGWTALNNIGLKVTDVKITLGSETWTKSYSGRYYSGDHTVSGATKILAISVKSWESMRATDYIDADIKTDTAFRVASNVNSFASATASNITFRVLYV